MFPWILCCILLIVVFFLITKIIFIEKSIDEIHTEFQERLSSDTNTLIDISSSDPHLRKLALEINIQLRLLRKERHRYQQGDLELKEAITNISHDLRTPLTAINGYLNLLEREEKNETVHCYLSQIQNRTDVLKNLIEELFRYSVVTSFQDETRTYGCCPGIGGKSAVFLCGHAGKRHPTGNRIAGGTGFP